MKAYYACLDTGFVKYCPQPLQHLAISNKATKIGGEISFYTMEDFDSLETQGTARRKINERPHVEGLIYFSIRQFFYGGTLHLNFLKFILDQGYEIHFAREDISISDKETLDDIFPILYSSQKLFERDEDRESWRPVWDSL